MNIVFSDISIFEAPRGYYLVDCISRDLRCAALPAQFDEIYGINDKISKSGNLAWDGLLQSDIYNVADVLCMVVKESTYDRVSLDDLSDVLDELRCFCDEYGIKRIAMPKICCGGNGLDWNDVMPIVYRTFEDSDTTIMICVGR